MKEILFGFASMVLPCVLFLIIAYGAVQGVALFDAFIEGAKDGLTVTMRILPALVGLLFSIEMLKASGGIDYIVSFLSPITSLIGLPNEVLPLAIIRPISGSGALAVVSDIFKNFGPDGYAGKIASVMMGSTETTFYTIAVYFGCVGITKTRYTVAAALIAELASFIASVFFVGLLMNL